MLRLLAREKKRSWATTTRGRPAGRRFACGRRWHVGDPWVRTSRRRGILRFVFSFLLLPFFFLNQPLTVDFFFNRPPTVDFWRNRPVAGGPHIGNMTDQYVPPVSGGTGRNCKPCFELLELYIEASKTRFYHSWSNSVASVAQGVLLYVFENILILLHPFMPFVTEELWQVALFFSAVKFENCPAVSFQRKRIVD
ncbi:hypothetical protein GW17_00016507 [Ensete ventricosum]|nr:hypothetical protein GW17_00016507 [Ensete ventricosum]